MANVHMGPIDRIHRKTAVIGVVGLGYVGMPLALRSAETDFPVLELDTNLTKVGRLNRGDSYINYIAPERVAQARQSGRFESERRFYPGKAGVRGA